MADTLVVSETRTNGESPRTDRTIMEYPKGRRDAISVRNACKVFNMREKEPYRVLANLNLTVKEGTIYTLLGSSGCGKTTLLSCIVGMTKLDDGDCRIFGLKPGSVGSGIPGKKVGYMPQEIALYGEFSIKEALHYFGRLNGIALNKIEDRMTFLIRFLHLPPSYRIIRSLSGGQQRRVSFAVALLHEPKLLILDEPTVGVDPVLRKDIWAHLREQAEYQGTTVIITTHYIEEALQANCIGLMRNGRLLAEDVPQRLLEQHNCTKLEDVFYKLCAKDMKVDECGNPITHTTEVNKTTVPALNNADNSADSAESDVGSESSARTMPLDISTENNTVELYNETKRSGARSPPIASPTTPTFNGSVEQLLKTTSPNTTSNGQGSGNGNGRALAIQEVRGTNGASKVFRSNRKPSVIDQENNEQPIEYVGASKEVTCKSDDEVNVWNIMRALILKNFLCMWRNLSFVLFIFFLPAVQAVLFCVAIGGEPTRLPMGIINYELDFPDGCTSMSGCALSNMSCNFVERIPNDTLTLETFHNESDALWEVINGNLWGYFVIPKNFSDAMVQRGVGSNQEGGVYEDGFQGMHVKLHLDMTSQQIAFSIQRALSLGFQKFTTDLLFDCGINDTLDVPPPSFAQPIYGGNDSSFREFMAPGIILSIIFFMSVALTGSAFITEKKEGMLARTMISGVTTGQIITAHMLTQYIIMAGQTVLVLIVMLLVFHIKIEGSTVLVIVLTLVQGTCGMAYGFLISVLCTDERNAIQMALGSFYPNLLLSGVVWPLESIPWYLRKIANFLPQTMACEAMRSIFSRAWGITHPKVWPGFASSIIWSIVFWTFALICAQVRKKRGNS